MKLAILLLIAAFFAAFLWWPLSLCLLACSHLRLRAIDAKDKKTAENLKKMTDDAWGELSSEEAQLLNAVLEEYRHLYRDPALLKNELDRLKIREASVWHRPNRRLQVLKAEFRFSRRAGKDDFMFSHINGMTLEQAGDVNIVPPTSAKSRSDNQGQ